LTAGTVGTVQAGMTAAMEPAGDGWFKCSITNTTSASTERAQYGVAANNGAFSYVGTAGLGVYIWGAQFTESAKPLPYVKTLDVAVTKTFAETLRTEYDPVTGENLGALIEGGSTNLALYSEDFSNAAWTKLSGATVASNTTLAPDNTFSADTLILGASNVSRTEQAVLPTSLVVHTFSFWARSDSEVDFRVEIGASNSGLTTRTASNKWQRFTVSGTPHALASVYPQIKNTDSIGKTLYIWGAQLEALPFTSSYIRTEGAAVSRSADKLSLPSTSALKENNFTIRTKFSVLHLNDPTPISYVAAHEGLNQPSGSSLRVFTYGLGILSRFGTSSSLNSGFGSIANIEDDYVTTYLDNTVRTYDNGVAGATTSGQGVYAPNSNNPVFIGANQSGNNEFLNGHISKLSTYAQAMTAQEITLL
jgi:hypothetical protein